jgi:ABC-type phosphate/phosphonate transport system substrate-binding protein
MKKLSYVLSVLFLAVFAMGCCNQNSPESIEKAIYTQFQKGNYEQGFDIMFAHAADKSDDATEEQTKELAKALSEKAGKSIEEKGNIKSFKVGKAEISEDGKSATVATTVTYGNGSTEDEPSKYVKGEDGQWGRVVFGK